MLPYVAQQAVQTHHWLSAGQMLDGLGLAETTPGPLIILRGNEALTTILSAVTAAVVGVVLNLAVWFGLHVIFPGDGTVDSFAILVGTVAFIGMVRWKWDIIPVVLSAGFAGLIFKMFLSYYH